MQETDTCTYVSMAADGDEFTREKLIRHYRPYILNVVGQICKRYVNWSDEESSIGLIAFNRAIDTYDQYARKSFLNYVYMLIKHDLIDYFKREQRRMNVPLEITSTDGEEVINVYDKEQAIDTYQASVEKQALVEEILELSAVLENYNIAFESLEADSPKHTDSRERLHELVAIFMTHTDLVDMFQLKRQLPIKPFVKRTDYKRKFLERHRKYIVTLIILKLHPEWTRLSEYIIDHGEKGGRI
ncbi:sigma factor [Lentibacillus saliphilus]|uniref:sigma factor n=1 Tax=Lentibacillus saliphilus TaxID=2737028 RepID=UPI001C2F9E52|nr:sigma factor [Lentibacillus saliphilus]